MSPRRGSRRRDTTSTQPVQVIIEVDGPPEPAEGLAPHRRSRLAALLAVGSALVVLIGVGFLFDSSDETPFDDAVPTSTILPVETTSTLGAGDLTIAASSLGEDRVLVSATSSSSGAPWVSFEMCASDPPGCTPLWTTDLDQEGSTSTAQLRVPESFRSPGGFEHDCATGNGCELLVATGDRSAVFSLDDFAPPAIGSTTTPAGEVTGPPNRPGPTVTVEPATAIDGEPLRVEIAGATADTPLSIAVCVPGAAGVYCPVVYDGTVDDDGTGLAELRLPRVVASRVGAGDGHLWSQSDCAVMPCELRVDAANGSIAVDLRFDDATRPPPRIALDRAGPFMVGEFVSVEGSGFDRVDATSPGRARWVVCAERPETLDDVPELCATPRTVRAPVIGTDGTFSLTLLVPEPALLRTWTTHEPLGCGVRCWLVVLAEPFPEIVDVPIEIRSTLPR